MTRADCRTLAWLAPLAVVLAFCWLFRAEPCLDDEIGNRLRTVNPPAVAESAEAPMAPGIATCDYWPDALDRTITFGTLGAIAVLIGFLSARTFQQRARIRAAVITFTALFLALAFNLLVYAPDILAELKRHGYGPLVMPMLLMLALILGAATMAWFSAMFALKRRPRD